MLRPLLTFGLTTLLAAQASALTLLADDRFVRTTVTYAPGSPLPDEDVTTTPPVPFGPFDFTGGIGEQLSEMTLANGPSGDTLTGSVFASSYRFISEDSRIGVSLFSITFEIETTGTYSFVGVLDAEEKSSSTTFSSSVRLIGPGGTVFEREPDYDPNVDHEVRTPFSATGVLGPGVYELRAQPEAFVKRGFVELDFTITDAVPEPATALLLAAGLAALAARRR